jgi:hypothetical protein
MDRGKTVYPLPLPVFILSLSIDITEEGSDVGDDSDDGDFEPNLNFTLRFVMLISYVSVVACLSLHRMGLLPDLTLDSGAGLRLPIDPSEAYDQISDCCHK